MVEKRIGRISHYFDKVQVAVIDLSENINLGDKISIKGYTTDFSQNVESMQINKVNIISANPGDEIGLKILERVRINDDVFLID